MLVATSGDVSDEGFSCVSKRQFPKDECKIFIASSEQTAVGICL